MGKMRQWRRVRVITDPVKYREYRRQQVIRKVKWVATRVGIVLLAAALIWLALEVIFQPRGLGGQ
jgi:hypothetical protein